MANKKKHKLSSLETDYAAVPMQQVHLKHGASFSALGGTFLIFFITLLLIFPSVFAFGQNTSAGNISNSTVSPANNTQKQTKPANTSSQPPVTTKISEKGIYQVQLTFISTLPIQSPNLLPKSGFQMEIDFLNASASAPTKKTIPQKESAIRGESSLGLSTLV
jgi:hypothetical protein